MEKYDIEVATGPEEPERAFPWHEKLLTDEGAKVVSVEYLYQAFKDRLMKDLVAEQMIAETWDGKPHEVREIPLVEKTPR